jgi:hypothetical protein
MNRPAAPYQADTLTRSRIPLTGHEIAKNDRNLALAHRSRRDFKGDVGKDLARTIDGITIEIEKCERCQKCRSIVSIDERMIGIEGFNQRGPSMPCDEQFPSDSRTDEHAPYDRWPPPRGEAKGRRLGS